MYYFEEKSIVEYSRRYSEKIAKAGVNLSEIKNNPQLSDAYFLLFENKQFSYFYGDSLYLEGSSPLVPFDYLYRVLNKKVFSTEPWYIVMDQCSDFFELYDANIQNRLSFAARNVSVQAEDYIIPLFIIFLNIRNVYSKIRPSLFIYEGHIVFRFERDYLKTADLYLIKHSNIYKLIVDILKLENKAKIDYIIENDLTIEIDGTIVTIHKELYSVRHPDKKSRIIDYIKAKKEVTAKELANYFNLSKRMINYYLAELIEEEIVLRIGDTNSSNARYKINKDKYYL